ncbi:hypothetical protein KCX83_21450 [Brucella oryzae]|uniref:hypothetical protein n=1 Tax=Brucella oryzae TaxID=335286 RepID=UPI001B824E7E|nr:hypothetical protein [Brucella oryzae]MBR7654859.1 hypothetical protein [Brucella oryzae]
MKIESKYSIGDTVYLGGTVSNRKQRPCPDCLGTRKWKATSPAGTDYDFSCPRCSTSYLSNRDMSLEYSLFEPAITKLTIGSVQFNSAEGAYDHGFRYMCVETGVGSGSVYNESDLHLSEDEATAAAQLIANEQNQTVDWVVKQFNQTLEISDYQLGSAALKLASDKVHASGSMLYRLQDLFEQIKEAGDKDEILEAIGDYVEHDWQNDKAKALELARGGDRD